MLWKMARLILKMIKVSGLAFLFIIKLLSVMSRSYNQSMSKKSVIDIVLCKELSTSVLTALFGR